MKQILTKKEAWKECNKILATKNRIYPQYDKVLFKECINNFNNRVFAKGIKLEETKLVHINGIDCTYMVLYNPYVVYLSGYSIGACFTDTFSQIIIFVDDDYDNLSKNAKEFIVQHELGHIVNNHSCIDGKRNIIQEFDADAYAAKKCDSISALKEIINLHVLTEESILEVNQRIMNL